MCRTTFGQGIRSGCGIVPITGPGGLQHYATADRRSSSSLRLSAWKGSQSSLSKAFRFNAKSSRSGSSVGDRTSLGNSTSPTPSFSSSEGGGGIYATVGPQFVHYPPPTTAPPPPPTPSVSSSTSPSPYSMQYPHYGQAAIASHRISAPPVGSGIEAISDPNLLYEQHRRVKSISDIGRTASTQSAYVASSMLLNKDKKIRSNSIATENNSICSGLSENGDGDTMTNRNISRLSNSPV
uniref:Uncharacterized protein n=1 Tax=Glossina brevipalpis TaxID=37001 RepID=A0A1A9X3E1_9MUSC